MPREFLALPRRLSGKWPARELSRSQRGQRAVFASSDERMSSSSRLSEQYGLAAKSSKAWRPRHQFWLRPSQIARGGPGWFPD
jgi:hypothetical protein